MPETWLLRQVDMLPVYTNTVMKTKHPPEDPRQELLSRTFLMIVEELRHYCPGLDSGSIQGVVFLVDGNSRIVACDETIEAMLSFEKHEVRGKLFTDLLTDDSAEAWNTIGLHLTAEWSHYTPDDILFRTKNGFLVKCFCYAAGLDSALNELMIATIRTVLPDKAKEKALTEGIEVLRRQLTNKTGNGKNGRHNGSSQVYTSTDDERVAKAAAYLLDNLRNPLQLSVLTDMAGMSRSKFKKYFLKMFGMNVQKFFTREMGKKAKRLLLEYPDKKVEAIAGMLGYTLQGFNRMFLKEVSKTPQAYRKRNRSNGQLDHEH